MPLISAHRGGATENQARENSASALLASARGPGELVEFDLQRCADGQLVLNHDPTVPGRHGEQLLISEQRWEELCELSAIPLITYDRAVPLLAARGKIAHIDIKFTDCPIDERLLAQQALEAFGPEGFILTSLEEDTVANLRRWAREKGHPNILVGLSLGRGTEGLPWGEKITLRRRELFPERRLSRCQANLLVANKTLARIRLASLASKHRLPLLVWTVDQPDELQAWLSDSRPWAITTNYPQRALRIRQQRFVT